MSNPRLPALLAALALGTASSCAGRPLDRELVAPAEVVRVNPSASPFLKAHMKDGRLCVLSHWRADDAAKAVWGSGTMLQVDRTHAQTGDFTVHYSEVALFETNAPVRTSPSLSAMAVVTGVSLVVTAACLINPKACFGSCPTFYVSDGERPLLQAEGFSDSIAPSLEATDVDALYRARASGRRLEVRMTNEALETHVVKNVEIELIPRPPGGRAFHAEGDGFYPATALEEATACEAAEGSCLAALRAFDGRERTSPADEHDLAAREEITFTFPATRSPSRGLVVAARQTLVTTYLLYQGLAYLGTEAGAALSALERDRSVGDRLKAAHRALGAIEVLLEGSDGHWSSVGEVFETGPIATDVHLVRLPAAGPGPERVRLRLARGNWRLDWVGLAALGPRVEPERLVARSIVGLTDERRQVAVRPGETIVALPGDAYTFDFELPEHPERYELFLSSRGYYLEWIRKQWLEDESPARAALMMYAPATAMRLLAPEFKRREADMERSFWQSRYARP